jgi:hypothetical protein
MEFRKYQHVERLGSIETEGILNGMCYVFPKIDGTNASLWSDKGELKAGSRNRELSLDNDNAGFYEWAINPMETIGQFFLFFPDLRLYGEWLVPHTLMTYNEDAWRKFYVFDVVDKEGKYLEYEVYKEILDKYGIDYIPPICKVENPTQERLINQLKKNYFLIKDGEGTGEGVVIKNYDYVNKYGRVTWAKIVENEFKSKHQRSEITELKEKKEIESEIVNKFVTIHLVDKEYQKIVNENGWSSKLIPRLLNTIFYCLVKEESWNFVKHFKNPKVDFKRLSFHTTLKIKELKPELF